MTDRKKEWTAGDMKQRLVRYAELRPCYNAFIDTRTPGSEAKENFTIIGPGVSENPEQHVHISEPHGYNIGGARQPPNCVNSQHSHKTAEVFVVHSGKWRFDFGEEGDDAQVVVKEGDVVSLPTNTFRGFTNVGEGSGFLWAVLGKDDPGRVTWAPKVFEMAREYGLILLESGSLVDAHKGERVPEGARPMAPPSAQELQALRTVSQSEAENYVWRTDANDGNCKTKLIGNGAYFDWSHGFIMDRLRLRDGESTQETAGQASKVLFVHEGEASFHWPGGELPLGKGDTLSVPRGLTHTIYSEAETKIFLVREGENSE